ncbi:hypothetical protein IA57_07775 [Mangrovimonas yunxiaonensis]|uniref:Secretion system C-terminal sorting domain-containing protein n=1 Tax=Mangrovimonas yunxiaonensis TaxID=1197477 RepID=A0A084TI39_9FLAO|nr:T9SS type A sorting domain-containing protein [Mangrovimonas yunxiaonensis]KFB00375.1 hypothetical protein IA57_07775 [Mangrovimonas yunxiaonensis]GGH35128.1 hypothetical protein GCM10011364_01430 [Mangrovimonas yunxiaonensis]
MKLNYLLIFLLHTTIALPQAGSESNITSIQSTILYQGFGETQGHIGTGEYKIYYDNLDGVLDKPIFFVDGFDPNDSRNIPAMYSLLDYGDPVENLADVVRDQGFDLVVLNFPTYTRAADGAQINGGADFIQRNAFILIELINTINAQKQGNEENVVIGPSMGGLISRYALKYMEQNTLNHDTRLYISFDSPHLGANVPIGIQYLFNYMVNGDPGITEAEPLVSGLLNSPAAKQMLIDHYLGHVDGSGIDQDNNITHTPIGAPNFRDAFQTELDGMGFPENTRNITIANGSNSGQMTGTPGLELINHTFDTGQQSGFDTQATIQLHFAPSANQTITVTDFLGEINLFGSWVPAMFYSADAMATASSDGLDSAPGGQFDMHAFDDGSNAMITEFVNNLNSQYFCFIPTLSALAITDNNWYASPNLNNAPFDDAFVPTDNEPHVTLTEPNITFALNEILQGTLSVEDLIATKDIITLRQNPVLGQRLKLYSNTVHKQASIHINDMTGKQVFKSMLDLQEQADIPISLASGMYLLEVTTQKGTALKTKLLVK